MKKLHFLITACALWILIGCKSYPIEYIKDKPYKAKDYITKVLEVYEPKELLYPVLDSIMMKIEECPEYQGRKYKITYTLNIKEGNIFAPEEERNDPRLLISVNYYIHRLTDFSWIKGVFTYKEHYFYVGSLFMDTFLTQTGKTTSITCIDPKKYQLGIYERGDRDMYWWYRYKDGALINLQYGYCPGPWFDIKMMR